MKTDKKLLIYIIAICALFCSCGGRDYQHAGEVFRYNESKDIPTLDPAFARNQTIIWPTNQIFNGLVQMDEQMNIVPCIAKEWTVSDNGRIYTFTLRDDISFHKNSVFGIDSTRIVKASDFVYSFNRIIDKTTASPGRWIFNSVDKGVANNGFEAVNDTTLKIYLNKPFPAFTGILTMKYCSVVPHEAIEQYGDLFGEHPVGTGPFMFRKWRRGEKLILTRNTEYFEKDSRGVRLPYLSGIAITFINDKQSEFLEFLQGRIDFISGLSPANKDELLTRTGNLRDRYNGKVIMDKLPYLNTEYLAFLNSDEDKSVNPYADSRVRMAINLGFDRVKMMLYLRNNMGTPAINGFIPKGLPSYNANYKPYSYNYDKAAELLKEAGYPEGKGLPELVLHTTSDYVDLCQYIQHQMSELGINMSIDVMPGAVYREKMANGNLGFFRGSWIADYPDAENYLSLFYSINASPNGPNYTRFRDSDYDRIFDNAINETNRDKRVAIYRELNKYVSEKSVVVPLYYDQVVRFYHNNIVNFVGNPLNNLDLKRVSKQ